MHISTSVLHSKTNDCVFIRHLGTARAGAAFFLVLSLFLLQPAKAQVCSLTVTATAGACNPVTNTYSSTAVVRLTNTVAGTITVSDGPRSLTAAIPSGVSSLSFTATFTGITADGATHMVSANLPNCGTSTTTYPAPAACGVCSLTATTTVGACAVATNTYSASTVVRLTNPPGGVLTVMNGAQSLTATIPSGLSSFTYTASFNGLTADGASHTVTANLPGCGSTTSTYTAPVSCSAAQVCSVSAIATAGVCNTATNTYSSTVVVSVANPTSGATLTVTDGALSQPFTTTAAGQNTFTAVFTSLPSNGATHTVSATLPGCGTTTTSYMAPPGCAGPCSVSAVTTQSVCNTSTNTYSSTVVATVLNPNGGTITISDGALSQTFATTANSQNTFTSVFNGLPSNGSSHTVTVSLPGCGSAITTYTAPASCSVTPACSVGTPVVTVGTCASATNTYSTTAVVTVQNPVSGSTLTISNGTTNQPFTTTAGSSNTFTMVFNGQPSNGSAGSITATLPGCGSASTPFTAPVSCSAAPVCSITPVVTAGQCASATNTYSSTAVVRLSNPPAGVLTVTDGTRSLTTTIASGLSSFTFTATFNGLTADASTRTVTATLPGCTPATTTYTAPASCSVAPVCSVSAVATQGQCASATNAFSNTVIVALTNPSAGTLTVTDGPASLTYSIPATLGTVTVSSVFNGLPSTGATRTVTVSLPGCSNTTLTYTAPASCSTAAACSVGTPVVTVGACASATNTYSATAVVTLANPPAGILTVTNGAQSLTTTITSGLSSFTYTAVFNGLTSDGASHAVTASLPGCAPATAQYTAPVNCSAVPVCLINSPVVTVGNCASATNTYSTTAVVTIQNPGSGGTLTISNGTISQPFTTTAGSSNTFTMVFNGQPSNGAAGSITATLPGCGSATATYTAPASCSATPVCSVGTPTVTVSQATCPFNFYTVTSVVTVQNPQGGQTLTISSGTESRPFTTTAGASNSFTAVFNAQTNGVSTSAVTASLSDCGSQTATYTTPASCTIGPCSVSPAITTGQCATATNTYSTTVAVTLTNAYGGGNLVVTNGPQSQTQPVPADLGSGTYTFIFTNLPSDGLSRTVTASLPSCGSATANYTAPASCSSTTACPGCTTAVQQLPDAQLGTVYSTTALYTGLNGYSLVAGSLPPGLTISPLGVISGTASATGTFGFSVQTNPDLLGCFCTITLQLTVGTSTTTCPPFTLSPASLPNGQVGVPYNATLVASGGTGPYNFSLSPGSSGALPAGITLSPAGILSGTPSTTGSFAIRVGVSDSNGCFQELDPPVLTIGPNGNCPPAQCVPLVVRRLR